MSKKIIIHVTLRNNFFRENLNYVRIQWMQIGQLLLKDAGSIDKQILWKWCSHSNVNVNPGISTALHIPQYNSSSNLLKLNCISSSETSYNFYSNFVYIFNFFH